MLLIKHIRVIVMICVIKTIIIHPKYYNIENVDSYSSFDPLLYKHVMIICLCYMIIRFVLWSNIDNFMFTILLYYIYNRYIL